MLNKAFYTTEGKSVIKVIVRGLWTTDDNYICRTVEESPRAIIRSTSRLVTTVLKANKLIGATK